jgi:hypothetical protein
VSNVTLPYQVASSVIAARIYPFALTPAQVAQNFAAGYLWQAPPPGASGEPTISFPKMIKIGDFEIPVM